ncbi:hypothetical protein, partial [Desulfosporosinus sp. Sb-LF]|uniref:hypothetical protein n=1 Tax=Desulfosporosinus sp. Sb-LF TaxID=2560027 RepID=UPI0013053B34
RHAASVRPEPGSNSPKKLFQLLIEEDDDLLIVSLKLLRVSLIGCPCCLVFKDHGRFGWIRTLPFTTDDVNG